MWRVEKPTYDPVATLRLCSSRVRDPDLRTRLSDAEAEVWDAEQRYSVSAGLVKLHTLRAVDFLLEQVSAAEMRSVYENGMVARTSPGREVYDRLIDAAPQGLCPLCGYRLATTLDHHLPKAHFSALAVAPSNLVPACIECNKMKSSRHPATPEEETLHPYFDDIENDYWLAARIQRTSPPTISFYVQAPQSWTPELAARVENHFNTFELNHLYSTYAANHLSGLQPLLADRLRTSGPGGVQQHLLEAANGHRASRPNDWLGVMLAALGNDRWFCTQGILTW